MDAHNRADFYMAEARPVQRHNEAAAAQAQARYLESVKREVARMALSRTDGPRYRVRYERAGLPYGPTDEGLVRWVQEVVLARLSEGPPANGLARPGSL
jgi:hypothetical protein